MSAEARRAAVQAIAAKRPVSTAVPYTQESLKDLFGKNVFGDQQMRARLPENVYRSLRACMDQGSELDPALADLVANAMKEWALERGARTSPTGSIPLQDRRRCCTTPRVSGPMLMEFSGKMLVMESRRVVVPVGRAAADFSRPAATPRGSTRRRSSVTLQRRDAVHPDGVLQLDRRGSGQEAALALDAPSKRGSAPAARARRCARQEENLIWRGAGVFPDRP